MHPTQPKPGSKIAVVGASARAAAFSLLRAGYEVISADLFADADLARQCEVTAVSPYPEGFEDWLAAIECDGWLYTGALENYPDLVGRLSVLHPLLGHGRDDLRRVRDPLQMQSNLRHDGFTFPETRLAGTTNPSRNDWLTKTYRGSCGSGVGRPGENRFLQRRVEGISLAAVFQGKTLLGITRQLVGERWAGAGEFQYCGSIGRYPLPEAKLRHLEDLGTTLHAAFGMTHLYGVDLIDDGETLWVIEVNPRYTASMEIVERASQNSVFQTEPGGFGGPPPNPPGLDMHCVGKVVLYAKAPLTVSTELSADLLQQAGELPWPSIADIPNAGTELETGQPVMTLFAEGSSCNEVEANLKARVQNIEQQLYGRTFACD